MQRFSPNPAADSPADNGESQGKTQIFEKSLLTLLTTRLQHVEAVFAVSRGQQASATGKPLLTKSAFC